MARGGRKRFGKGERACTPLKCIVTKKKSFNVRERKFQRQGGKERASMLGRKRGRAMARERERPSIEGKEHAHP